MNDTLKPSPAHFEAIHSDAYHIDAIACILAAHCPGKAFSNPVLIGRGAVSTVYRVDVDGMPLAVKLHAAEREVISEYERQEYEREQRCLVQAKAVGIPVPEVLAVGWLEDFTLEDFASPLSFAYSLQTFVPGVNGLEWEGDPLRLWKELGRLARLIHAIPVEEAEFKWHHYLDAILSSLTHDDVKMALGMYAAHQQADLRCVFQKLKRLWFRYGLNHCDLHPKNTRVSADGMMYLLDWGAASRDINVVPHTELASLLWTLEMNSDPFRAFVSGYGLLETDWQSLLPEMLALDLASCFWFAENPPQSTFGEELVAHAKQGMAEYFLLLAHWASQ